MTNRLIDLTTFASQSASEEERGVEHREKRARSHWGESGIVIDLNDYDDGDDIEIIHEKSGSMELIEEWDDDLEIVASASRKVFVSPEELRRREAEISARRYECSICLDREVELSDMVTLSCLPTGHRFCNECFLGYCQSKINDACVSSEQLICPAPGCKTPVTIHEITGEHLGMNAELIEKYHRFSLRNVASASDTFRTCPGCNEWFLEVDLSLPISVWGDITCDDSACGYHFCGGCGQAPHLSGGGARNMDPLTCQEAAAFRKASSERNEADEAFASMVRSSQTMQICPGCKEATVLIAGCKYIKCKCGVFFCFLCGVKLTKMHHFKHFSRGGNWHSIHTSIHPYPHICICLTPSVRPVWSNLHGA